MEDEKKDRGRLGWVIGIVLMIIIAVVLTVLLLKAANGLDNCQSFARACPQLDCNGQDPAVGFTNDVKKTLDSAGVPYSVD